MIVYRKNCSFCVSSICTAVNTTYAATIEPSDDRKKDVNVRGEYKTIPVDVCVCQES